MRDWLETVAKVTNSAYRVVLDTAFAKCYLDTLPSGGTVSLDGVVAVSRIGGCGRARVEPGRVVAAAVRLGIGVTSNPGICP